MEHRLRHCPIICPNVFRMNDENKAEVFNETGDTEENIQSGIDACPTGYLLGRKILILNYAKIQLATL